MSQLPGKMALTPMAPLHSQQNRNEMKSLWVVGLTGVT